MPAEKLSDSRDLEFAIDKLVGGKGQNNFIGGFHFFIWILIANPFTRIVGLRHLDWIVNPNPST